MRNESGKKRPGTDWEARFDCGRLPHVKVLEKAFAGIPSGATMLIVTPQIVDELTGTFPRGAIVGPGEFRRLLARNHRAEFACPVTTGISLRVVAERAYLRLQNGADRVTPFWRVIDPDGDLAGKLACGREFIRRMRAEEATEPTAAPDADRG